MKKVFLLIAVTVAIILGIFIGRYSGQFTGGVEKAEKKPRNPILRVQW